MTDKDGLPVSTEPTTAGEAFAIVEMSGDSLQHRLDVYSGYSKGFYPEVDKAYEGLIGRIHGLKKAGPAIGTIIPDFVLPDHEGKLIGLASLIFRGARRPQPKSGSLVPMVSAAAKGPGSNQ